MMIQILPQLFFLYAQLNLLNFIHKPILLPPKKTVTRKALDDVVFSRSTICTGFPRLLSCAHNVITFLLHSFFPLNL